MDNKKKRYINTFNIAMCNPEAHRKHEKEQEKLYSAEGANIECYAPVPSESMESGKLPMPSQERVLYSIINHAEHLLETVQDHPVESPLEIADEVKIEEIEKRMERLRANLEGVEDNK